MTEYVWDKFLTERGKAGFAAGGFGTLGGCTVGHSKAGHHLQRETSPCRLV